MLGDADLPEGKVTFVVGPVGGQQRFENLSKNLLCVRSERFLSMFRAGASDVVHMPDDPAAFKTLISYIVKDTVHFESGSEGAAHAFKVLALARNHRMVRLEMLTMQALESCALMTTKNVVPLLEATCLRAEKGDERLFDACRKFVRDHGPKVLDSRGIDQLQQHEVTKGLLRDSIEEVRKLRILCGDTISEKVKSST
jgi:hypothetical protein